MIEFGRIARIRPRHFLNEEVSLAPLPPTPVAASIPVEEYEEIGGQGDFLGLNASLSFFYGPMEHYIAPGTFPQAFNG